MMLQVCHIVLLKFTPHLATEKGAPEACADKAPSSPWMLLSLGTSLWFQTSSPGTQLSAVLLL